MTCARSPLVRLPVALLAVLACTGCASQSVQLRGIAPLNRNAEGESTPVDVRIYRLGSDAAFSRAGFNALWTSPAAALGGDLMGEPVTATVLPGEATDATQSIRFDKSPWVGIQTLVRRDEGQPRTLLLRGGQIPAPVIEVTGYGLRLAGKKP